MNNFTIKGSQMGVHDPQGVRNDIQRGWRRKEDLTIRRQKNEICLKTI